MRRRYQVLFMAFVVFLLYYTSIFNPVNSIDDKKMFNWLLNINSINLKHLFFPHCGGYYRPVCILTYQIDRFLWLINESFYHLENIILHLINALLVFFVALKLFKQEYKYLPLFSALLFAVHPINTEAVNWISARCDLLAAMFSLSGFLMLLRSEEGKNRMFWLVLSAIVAFFGALSKEVGVAFYPAAIFWILFVEDEVLKKKIVYSLIFAAFLIFYFYLRHVALIHSDASFARVATSVSHYSYVKAMLIFIQALGFYVKKLIVPFPLNFGIIHISRLYLYVGMLVIFVILLFLYKRSRFTALFLIAVFFISPAFLVALGHVAWTPYAERYVYVASTFFSIFSVAVIYKLLKGKIKIFNYAMVILIVFFSASTFLRNRVWSSNLSLYKDTVEKSPDFIVARNEYANALYESGKIKEAIKQYKIASLQKGRLNVLPSLNLLLTDNETIGKEKQKLYALLGKLPRLNNTILQQIIKLNFKMLANANEKDKAKLIRENAKLYEKLYQNTGNGFYLYKAAQVYLMDYDKKDAKIYLKKVMKHLHKNSIYYKAATKLLSKLQATSP